MVKSTNKSKKDSVIIFRVPEKTKKSVSKKLEKSGIDMSTALNIILKKLDELENISLGIYGVVLNKKTGLVAHKSLNDMLNYIQLNKD